MNDLKSWIEIPSNSDFTLHNLPYGIFSTDGDSEKRVGIAVGNQVLDLAVCHELGFFSDLELDQSALRSTYLNDFIALGKSITGKVREQLRGWLSDPEAALREYPKALAAMDRAKLHMPVKVGDYTDFYSSIEHATNVGKMFRDPENALLPNWRHIPVGYHGRSSSIVESGIPVHRPCGQTKPADGPPVFGPSQRLDFELEMAFVVGKETRLGERVSTTQAAEHIFGLVLFNDLSARDIQKWEYVPLGPFLAKSFASSISPWVVPLEALAPFKTAGPVQEPAVLPYLQFEGDQNYDLNLEVYIQPEKTAATRVCQTNFKYMYWNMAQQLAHHTVNGCNLNVGDMMASGTISGPSEESFGSLLELSWGGSKPITLNDGSQRSFLHDYDTVIMRGFGSKGSHRVGFGQVSTQILPAIEN